VKVTKTIGGEPEAQASENKTESTAVVPTMVENQLYAELIEAGVVTVNPAELRMVARITRDAITLQKLGDCVLRMDGEVFTIPMSSAFTPGQYHDVACVEVTDVIHGQCYVLMCGTVLASTLRRQANPLEGRLFAMRPLGIRPGKRYRDVQVVEVVVEK